jgi:hypothetical protein
VTPNPRSRKISHGTHPSSANAGSHLYSYPFQLVSSMSASADVLALASAEFEVGGIKEGSTLTVKWRGKPVFIRHRTDEEIATVNAVPFSQLKDPQADSDRAADPKPLPRVALRHLWQNPQGPRAVEPGDPPLHTDGRKARCGLEWQWQAGVSDGAVERWRDGEMERWRGREKRVLAVE